MGDVLPDSFVNSPVFSQVVFPALFNQSVGLLATNDTTTEWFTACQGELVYNRVSEGSVLLSTCFVEVLTPAAVFFYALIPLFGYFYCSLSHVRRPVFRMGSKYSGWDVFRALGAIFIVCLWLAEFLAPYSKLPAFGSLPTFEQALGVAAIFLTVAIMLRVSHAEIVRLQANSLWLRLAWAGLVLASAMQLACEVKLFTESSDPVQFSFIAAIIKTSVSAGVGIAGVFVNGRKGHYGKRKVVPTGELRDPLLSTSVSVSQAQKRGQWRAENASIDTKPENDIEYEDDGSPESRAGCLSLLTFSWLNPLMRIGSKGTVDDEDLYPLHASDTTTNLAQSLDYMWNQEKRIAEGGGKASLVRALRRAFGAPFMAVAGLKFLYDTLNFMGPQLLKAIITYLSDTDGGAVGWGWFYVGLLVASNIVQTLVLHQYFHVCFRSGMRIRAGVAAIVYRKSLSLDPTGIHQGNGRKEEKSHEKKTMAEELNNRGAIVNLMSVDAQRLQDLMSYLHVAWSGPYQIVLCLYFLFVELGIFTLVGLGIMLLMIPLTTVVAKGTKGAQQQLMTVKDKRMKVTGDTISGIKIIKLYAWEDGFASKITQVRTDELKHLWRYTLFNVGGSFSWTIAPILVSVCTFAAYSFAGSELTPTKAFVALSLFNALQFPLAMLPRTISSIVESQVTVGRLECFLQKGEVAFRTSLPTAPSGVPAIELKRVDLHWDAGRNTNPLLLDVNMSLKAGQLGLVIGQTGSGKSGLCSSIIGDRVASRGTVTVRGSIAYAAQQAWIQNATMKDNILFGRPFNEELYQKVLGACALLPDLEVLPAGDMTEIGEKGVNLSGGQKQRVALARACYRMADVYILDDVLSAVDSHVARHIFDHCVKGLLRQKTVLLCTNNMSLLSSADVIFFIEGGRLPFVGTPQQFYDKGYNMARLETNMDQKPIAEEKKLEAVVAKKVEAPIPVIANKPVSKPPPTPSGAGRNLIVKEKAMEGSVSWDVYRTYIKAAGGTWMLVVVLLCLVLSQGLSVGSGRWLAFWSQNAQENSESSWTMPEYAGVYALLAISGAFAAFGTSVVFAYGSMRASKSLHAVLLDAIVRAPMSFFDTTTQGSILNRFSSDMYNLDETLATALSSYLRTTASAIATVFVIVFVTPWFGVAILPVALFYWNTQRYYIPTSRQLQRITSKSKSPIIAHFSETLDGVSTIRAFGEEARFMVENITRLDTSQLAYYLGIAGNRWLATRLEFVGTCIVGLAAGFAVAARSPGDLSLASLGGLSITYALSVTQTLNWLVRMTAERETNIVSVERISEFSRVSPEAASIVDNFRPPSGWPSAGAISLSNLYLRYRNDLPFVLKGIRAEIRPGEKIGIVGRTGSGKSSLLYTLLRLVEPCSSDGAPGPTPGAVKIDGIDVARLGLKDLRSSISIIPQDPWLANGTIRFNVDPLKLASDTAIWNALKKAHIGDHILGLEKKLDHIIEAGGRNFSVGQSQLICLARALLRQSRLLLLDEATAAVDPLTDDLIQRTIREEFRHSTVLTIAHRLHTIMDSDRVLVLEAGNVVEFDSPKALLEQPGSFFAALHKAAQNKQTKEDVGEDSDDTQDDVLTTVHM